MGPGFTHARTSELAALGALRARLPGYHAVTTTPCATSSPEPCAEPVAWKSALRGNGPNDDEETTVSSQHEMQESNRVPARDGAGQRSLAGPQVGEGTAQAPATAPAD